MKKAFEITVKMLIVVASFALGYNITPPYKQNDVYGIVDLQEMENDGFYWENKTIKIEMVKIDSSKIDSFYKLGCYLLGTKDNNGVPIVPEYRAANPIVVKISTN